MTTFGKRMKALVAERQTSLGKLGKAINYDVGYLSRISNDRQVPSMAVARLIDAELGAGGELVALLPDKPPRQTSATRGLPAGTVGARPPGHAPEDDDDVKRRAVLEILAALGAGTAVPPGALEEIFAGIEHAIGDRVDVDDWERTVHEYGYLIIRQPVGSLIGDLTADVVAVGRLLGRQHPPLVRAGLLRISAALSGLLAIELGDVGERRATRVSWETARHAADASGDRDLRVWVRGREAGEAFWAGRSDRVVADLADEAARIAGGAPSAGLARAHSARCCLALGQTDTAGTHTALRDLKQTFERLPDPTTADQSHWGYGERSVSWSEAYVYTLTGDDRAVPALERALALCHGTLGPVANLQLIRAMGLVRDREIDEGLRHAVTTLQGGPVSATRHHMAGQILKDLPAKARELPAARELRALTAGNRSSD